MLQKRAARRGTRLLALLLCLVMTVSLLPVMGANAAESGGNSIGSDAAASSADGLVLDKYLTQDTDGTYKLTLEAYATGNVTTTGDSSKPLDIVLVLDQSGSMAWTIGESITLSEIDKSKEDGYYVIAHTSGFHLSKTKYTKYYLVRYDETSSSWQYCSNENGVNSWTTLPEDYQNDPVYVTRLGALKEAVNSFISNIENDAERNGVKHRIAIVGFSSSSYNNTELLTGVSITSSQRESRSRYFGYNKDDTPYLYPYGYAYNGSAQPTQTEYEGALLDVTDTNNQAALGNAVKALTAHGGTYTDDGLNMAVNIFKYDTAADKNQRQHVVVLFTDGATNSGENTTIQTAYSLKNTYSAKVYTVGIFDGADPTATRGNWNSTNDFMHYLSSNYPDARGTSTDSGSWNYCGTGTRPTETTAAKDWGYYYAADDENSLKNVFQTIKGSITGGATYELTSGAVLKDVISDSFETTNSTTVTAKSYAYVRSGEEGSYTYGFSDTPEKDSTGEDITYDTSASTEKNISVTGFDYGAKYVAIDSGTQEARGSKLVVTITGLIPNTAGEKVYSNAFTDKTDPNGVYENSGSESPAASFPEPYTNIPEKTKVLDFSMTADIATQVGQYHCATSEYGAFSVASEKMTYALDKDRISVATGYLVFDGVDSVMVFGDYSDGTSDTTRQWQKVNVVPANNVYYDDDLLNEQSTFTDGVYGYDNEVPATTGTTGVTQKSTKTFTFTGTGIDIYCTTESDSGKVFAQLRNAEGDTTSLVTDKDGSTVSDILINDQYVSGTLKNVPTISFSNLEYGKYTVTITAGSNYKLDGVRVYNPSDSTSVTDHYVATEQNATFTEVRSILLTNNNLTGDKAASGVVYIDKIPGNGEAADVVTTTTNLVATYDKYGPKNEVYLDNGNAIAFKVDGYTAGMTVQIGLSVPDTEDNSTADGKTTKTGGKVTVTVGSDTTTIDLGSEVDMYYTVTPTSEGYVVIRNTGSALVSVTKVKLSGTEASTDGQTLSVDEGVLAYAASFNSLAVTEPDVDPTPDPAPTADLSLSAMIQAIWTRVMDGVGKLFRH